MRPVTGREWLRIRFAGFRTSRRGRDGGIMAVRWRTACCTRAKRTVRPSDGADTRASPPVSRIATVAAARRRRNSDGVRCDTRFHQAGHTEARLGRPCRRTVRAWRQARSVFSEVKSFPSTPLRSGRIAGGRMRQNQVVKCNAKPSATFGSIERAGSKCDWPRSRDRDVTDGNPNERDVVNITLKCPRVSGQA